jgi:nucleoid-associated protein YgaU
LKYGIEMKNPVLLFTSIAGLAAAALGGTIYYQKTTKPEVIAIVAPVKPAVETPAKLEDNAQIAVAVPKAKVSEAKPAKPETVVPSFDTVRVENTGEAVIAGRAEPDSDVTVKLNGEVVGSAKSAADGSFVVIPDKPFNKGTGALTLEVSKNGAVTQSEGSVIVAVKGNVPTLVAKIDPVAPTEVIQSGDATLTVPKDVQLTAVDYDTAGNIVFSGKAAPNTVVRFYVDNAAVGEGLAGQNGTWSFKGSDTIKPGNHTLRADALDASGKVVSRIELPFQREDLATVAAAQVAAPEATPKAETKVAVIDPPLAPAVEIAPTPEVVAQTPQKIIIQPGNNLWKLSREVYGKGRMFTIIYEANRDQLKNPNMIFPGQILTAPKQN